MRPGRDVAGGPAAVASGPAATGCALLVAVIAGAAPGGALLLLAVLAAAGWLRAGPLAGPSHARVRRTAAAAVAGIALLDTVVTVGRGGAALPSVLLLLVGLSCAQVLRQETSRDVAFGAAAPVAMLLVAASVGPPPPRVAPLFLACWALTLAVVVVAAALPSPRATATLVADASAGRPADRPAGRFTGAPVAAAAAAVAVGLLALLLVPRPDLGPPRRLDGLGAAGALGADGADGRPAPPSGRASGPRSADSYSDPTMDLRMRGRLGDRTVASVPAASPALWRSGVLTVYVGGRWVDALVDGPPAGGPVSSAEVRPLDAPTRAVLTPGALVDVRPRDGVGGRGDRWAFDGPRAARRPYVVSWVGPGGSSAPADPGPAFRQLPDSLPARVTELGARLTADAADTAAAVRAVEAYLRTGYRYRLDLRVPGPSEDPVDAFLFTDRVGFCEHFAAAEVLLLRAGGISARVATGFGYGTVEGDRRVFRQKDAHAWVEVWIPGRGWVPSDPTAGVPLADDAEGRLDAATRALQEWLSSWGHRLLLALLLLAVAGAVGAVAVPVWRRRRHTGATGAPPGSRDPLVAAWLRLETALAAVQRPRAPAESLAELGARVPDARGGLAVLEHRAYAPGAAGGASRAVLESASALDAVSARLLATHAAEQRAAQERRGRAARLRGRAAGRPGGGVSR